MQKQQIPDVVSGAETSFSFQDGFACGKVDDCLKSKVKFVVKNDL